MKHVIIINFKTYKNGKDVVKLAKEIEKVSKEIIVGVQASDISEIVRATKLKVFVQHVDYFEKGKNTGYIIPEAVKSQGAIGSFLNHSEHKLNFDVLVKTIKRCKKSGLKIAVFAESLKECLKIGRLGVDYLIYEPPELVGGEISVSKARPEIISKISKRLKKSFLVGAGIKNREDVKIALKLGACGIAVSSGVVNAINPQEALRNLIHED